ESRHADVAERDLRPVLGDGLERRAAILARGDDLEIGPRAREERYELVTQQRFVFGDDALHRPPSSTRGAGAFGTVIVAATPLGKFARMENVAASPYASRSRSRTFFN